MFIRFCLSVLLALSYSSANADPAPAKKLEAVKTEINSLSDNVNLNKASKKTLYKQLKKESLAVSRLNKELKAHQQKINKQSAELEQLAKQEKQHNKKHSQHLTALNEQIRTSYINSAPSVMKVLLNQEDPATLSRSTIYYRYFHQARQQQLTSLTKALENLTTDQKRLFQAQKEQRQLYAEQEKKQVALKSKTQKREAILASLDKKISSQGARLQLLREQEQSLQAVLAALSKAKQKQKQSEVKPTKVKPQVAKHSTSTANSNVHRAFAKRVGSLTWPVKGKILAGYGSPTNLGKLTWQGIIIAAPTGNNVVAAAPGKIVFADWLRGFGLLLIIDHGDQYMTLYGNNETLLTQVGDNVTTGDLIAQSGKKDGRKRAGLYFELRHKGNPTNPMRWLSKRS